MLPGTWASLSEDKRSGLARLAARVADNFTATLAEAIPLETYRQIQVPVLLLGERDRPRPHAGLSGCWARPCRTYGCVPLRTLDTCCR